MAKENTKEQESDLDLAKKELLRYLNDFELIQDSKYKIEIEKLYNSLDEKKSKAYVGPPLRFSTGGIRAIMNHGYRNINPITVNIIVTSLVEYIKVEKKEQNSHTRIIIGFDGRHNSKKFAELACEVVNKYCPLFSAEIVPIHCITPFLASIAASENYDFGIMITASHNDKNYNGLKIYTGDGYQVSAPLDKGVENMMKSLKKTNTYMSFYNENFCNYLSGGIAKNENFSTTYSPEIVYLPEDITTKLLNKYISTFCRSWYTKRDEIIKNNIKICFSALNGPSRFFLESSSKFFGLYSNFIFYEPQCIVDPEFSHFKHPNPEDPEVLIKITEEFAIPQEIEYIFVTDPDGDRFRMAQVLYSKEKKSVLKIYDSEEIALLLADYLYGKFEKNRKDLCFINTMYCTGLLEKYCYINDIKYKSVPNTGFKHIVKYIKEDKLHYSCSKFLAFEDSYGFLLGEGTEKDGITCCIIMAEIIIGGNPLERLNNILSKTGKYVNCKETIKSDCANQKIIFAVEKMMKEVISCKYDTNSKSYLITDFSGALIRFRKSGTEPIIKIYSNSMILTLEQLEKVTRTFVDTYFNN